MPKRTRNSTFGFVFQRFFLTPNMSVRDNVTPPPRPDPIDALRYE